MQIIFNGEYNYELKNSLQKILELSTLLLKE
jgi:hypothetical protein